MNLVTCLKFLHNTGFILFQNDMICTQPQGFVKIMASFVAPEIHISRNLIRKDEKWLLSSKEFISELKLAIKKNKINIMENEHINEFSIMLENFGFYYKLSPKEHIIFQREGYLFPSLRPSCDSFPIRMIQSENEPIIGCI
jgi:hypothetical protein